MSTDTFTSKIKNLFSIEQGGQGPTGNPHNLRNIETNKQTTETYEQWGTRICGIVSGELPALAPFLGNVYNYCYNVQAKDKNLQEQAKETARSEINSLNGENENLENQITAANDAINQINRELDECKQEQEGIKASKESINKDQRLKLIIGLVILTPLTFYLFLFYSSTFYSAFFRDSNTITDVMNSMFDSNAIANAYRAGLTELGFVLSAPIIFLGLGFALHFFSVQQGWTKYVKMSAILIVTLLFDCILAYKIGDQIHYFGQMSGTIGTEQEYTFHLATHDINTWAVIFCGFIVYIIWGIIFDMCLTAYDKMDLNKTRFQELQNKISEKQQRISDEKARINDLKNQINNNISRIKTLTSNIGHEVYIDYHTIRTEMNKFFSGWIKMMQVQSIDTSKQAEATKIYEQQIASLFNT